MAYDEDLAMRIREVLAAEPGLSEKKMFGGLGFMLDGHLAVAAGSSGGMMVRADPADVDAHTAREGVAPMEMRGRPMAGWLLAEPTATSSDADLERWVAVGVDYVRGLPPKA